MVNALTGITFVGGKSEEIITRGLGAALEEITVNARMQSVTAIAGLKDLIFMPVFVVRFAAWPG